MAQVCAALPLLVVKRAPKHNTSKRRTTMKNNLSRILTIVPIAQIDVWSAAAPAAAQNAYNGRFTLPNDVRWAAALLPAGEYTFPLKSNVLPAQIVIHR